MLALDAVEGIMSRVQGLVEVRLAIQTVLVYTCTNVCTRHGSW